VQLDGGLGDPPPGFLVIETRDVLGPTEGEAVSWGGFGVRFMIDGEQTGGRFSLVEHPIAPRALATPTHTHEHEDEYTYVVEGQVGVLIGERESVAGPEDLVFKPRGVPHAFWNAGDEEARLLELISPAAFASYFAEMAPVLSADGPPDFHQLDTIRQKYGLSMDIESREALMREHGLER
jgi:quercetin dioxygenase-like cupin family protein